ncbi:MAG: carbohydrate ABC transporter permease [Chloroflexi bacterium]|nr:carbohydrate ABC transporter permease [Chloroflexota bacterium]
MTEGVSRAGTTTIRSSKVQIKRAIGQGVILLVLAILLALTMVPIVNMLTMSLKDNGQIFARFWAAPNPYRWRNYAKAWEVMRGYIANSLLVSISAMFGVVFLASISGYVFARHRFPGKNFLYLLILALMMIPGMLTLIPSFMLINDLGLIDTRWALILPWISGGQVFGILICRGFFGGLPEELFEAARMDGAREFGLYWKIAVPLSWPIMVTLAIMNLVGTYNDFLWPLLVLTSTSKQVVSVGLREFNQSGMTDWGPRMAAYTIATVPLLLLFAFGMRYYIQGITSGAIKA